MHGPMAAVPTTPGALDLADSGEPEVPAFTQHNRGDRIYRGILTALAACLPLLLLAVALELLRQSWPAINKFGWHFVTGSVWDPVAEVYGAAPMIFGTLFSSAIALAIAVPLSL